MNLIRKILLKDFKVCDKNADVYAAYEETKNVHERNCICATTELPANSILSSILKAQLLVKNNFFMMEILNKLDETNSCDMSNQTTLQNYKIGSTALDCSIMITLRRINGHFVNVR